MAGSLVTDPQRQQGQRAQRRPRQAPGRVQPSRLSGLALSLPFLVFASVLIIYPFIRLVGMSLSDEGLQNYRAFFNDPASLQALVTTFVGSAVVAVLAIFLGALVAWALRTTSSRATRLLILTALLIPFWMGSVVKIYAFTVLLGRMGLINRALLQLNIIESPIPLMYNPAAVVIEMTYQMLPYAVAPLLVAFLSIDLSLVQAAQSLGASRLRALRDVVVPQAMPGILATATLVYVISLGFYIAPILMGGATRPFSASLISQDIFMYYNLPDAAVSSVVLLLGAVAVVALATLLVGRKRLSNAIG